MGTPGRSPIVLNEGTLDPGGRGKKWSEGRTGCLPFLSKLPDQVIYLEGLSLTFAKNESLHSSSLGYHSGMSLPLLPLFPGSD
jgi:hypothetical protein